MIESEEKYFNYIGHNFQENSNSFEKPTKAAKMSLEEKLKYILADESNYSNAWKDNTDFIKELGYKPLNDDSLFLDGGALTGENSENLWGFKNETFYGGLWPERYNKLHNYFLLSKDEGQRQVVGKMEEVISSMIL